MSARILTTLLLGCLVACRAQRPWPAGAAARSANGSGAFQALPAVLNTAYSLVSGDFNRDGRSDLAFAPGSSSQVGFMLGTGAGAFSPASYLSVGRSPYSSVGHVTLMDADRDGQPDLVVGQTGATEAALLRGLAGGTFAAPEFFTVNNNQAPLAVGDLNGDGAPDLVAGEVIEAYVAVLLNACP